MKGPERWYERALLALVSSVIFFVVVYGAILILQYRSTLPAP